MPLGHNKPIYMYMYMLCLQQLFASQYCKRCDINVHGTVLHVHTYACAYIHVHVYIVYMYMVHISPWLHCTVVQK